LEPIIANNEPREGQVKLLYFAWVRQKVGVSEEELRVPPSVKNVSALIDFLKSRGAGYEAAFRDLKALRVAVNQQHSAFDTVIAPNDEIAFFPPVTGG
jgi:molybdopterin synthase sulfur carrier subunit